MNIKTQQIIPNIELKLLNTNRNEKCLIFILPDKKWANKFIDLFTNYELYHFIEDNRPVIRITFNEWPEIIKIKIIEDIANIDWLLNHEINVISVGYNLKDKLVYNHPFPLNYQPPR
jgi:hypothetical protein